MNKNVYPSFFSRAKQTKETHPETRRKKHTEVSPNHHHSTRIRHLPGAKGIQASGPRDKRLRWREKAQPRLKKLVTLPETNSEFTPENRVSQKERIVFQPSIFRCKLAGFVSGRVVLNLHLVAIFCSSFRIGKLVIYCSSTLITNSTAQKIYLEPQMTSIFEGWGPSKQGLNSKQNKGPQCGFQV